MDLEGDLGVSIGSVCFKSREPLGVGDSDLLDGLAPGVSDMVNELDLVRLYSLIV